MTGLLAVFAAAAPAPAADRAAWIELARLGWNYQLREPPAGRDMSIPVVISPKSLVGAALCVVGERPHPATVEVLDGFRALVRHVFGKPLPMRYAGPDAMACGSGRVAVLRLFSGFPPNAALTRDLAWLNGAYQLGLPEGREYATTSPAMAQTFFGRRGQATHIMVKQPRGLKLDRLEAAFFRSILIEELFQAFTFGADILIARRAAAFESKLQEVPVNLSRLPWDSRAFMRALLGVTPGALCPFDVFMLHAVARTTVEQTVEPAFLRDIEANFRDLETLAAATSRDPRFAGLIDLTCERGQYD